MPDLAVHVNYLEMLSCCSAGDVPLSWPGDEVNSVSWTGPHFIAPSEQSSACEVSVGSFEGFFKGIADVFECCVLLLIDVFCLCSSALPCVFLLQHTSHGDGRQEVSSRTGRSGARCRNSIASCADEQPHIGNYRLLKTIGKGNFAKVKLARHILTGREVTWYGCKQQWVAVGVNVLLE